MTDPDKKASDDLQIFSTVEAAEYLGVSVPTVKYHLYVAKDLEPDTELGGRLVFTKATLDHFNEHVRREPGRPGKNEDLPPLDPDVEMPDPDL